MWASAWIKRKCLALIALSPQTSLSPKPHGRMECCAWSKLALHQKRLNMTGPFGPFGQSNEASIMSCICLPNSQTAAKKRSLVLRRCGALADRCMYLYKYIHVHPVGRIVAAPTLIMSRLQWIWRIGHAEKTWALDSTGSLQDHTCCAMMRHRCCRLCNIPPLKQTR